MRQAFLAIFCLLIAASAASAQALPSFNMRGHCLRLAMTPNLPTETVYDSCMAGEEAAYGQLYHWWGEIGGETRMRCINYARGSYVTLQLCIDSSASTSE
jgi:hypothetical protein